jgi:hypothetical protein
MLLLGPCTVCLRLPPKHSFRQGFLAISGDRTQKHPLTRQCKVFAIRRRLRLDSLASPCFSGLSWLSYSSSSIYPDRRVWSDTRSRLSPGRELPTPAKLNEPRGPGPLGQDLHLLCVTAAFIAMKRRRYVAVAPAPVAFCLGPRRIAHRIECRDYSENRCFCDTKAACTCVFRITPTSLRRARTSPSPGIRLYGSARKEMVSLHPLVCW